MSRPRYLYTEKFELQIDELQSFTKKEYSSIIFIDITVTNKELRYSNFAMSVLSLNCQILTVEIGNMAINLALSIMHAQIKEKMRKSNRVCLDIG